MQRELNRIMSCFSLLEIVSRSYRGEEGEYVERFWMEIDSDCPVCGVHPSRITLSVHSSSLLQEVIDLVSKQINHPFSLWMGTTPLFADVVKTIRVYPLETTSCS